MREESVEYWKRKQVGRVKDREISKRTEERQRVEAVRRQHNFDVLHYRSRVAMSYLLKPQ